MSISRLTTPTNNQQKHHHNHQHQNHQSIEYAAHIYYQNPRGLRTKSKSFFLSTHACDYDIVALTETWFNDSHLSTEYFDQSYIVHRNDRNANNSIHSRGGGVLIATKTTIHSERLLQNEYLNLNFVCLKCSIKSEIFIIYVLYIPPNSSLDIYQSHLNAIKFLSREYCAKIIIIGDFNLPGIKWVANENNDHFLPVNVRCEEAILTCDSLLGDGFYQVNNIRNHYGNVLDLVFVNDQNFSSIFKSNDPLSKVDISHYPFDMFIECLEFDDNEQESNETIYAFHKANFHGLNDFIENADFFTLTDNITNIDDTLDYFYDILYAGFESFVPKAIAKNNNHPPWYNRNLIKLKNGRNKLHKRIKASIHNVDEITLTNLRSEYAIVKNTFEALQNFLYQNYLLEMESNLKSDPTQFWRYVALKKGSNSLPLKMSFNENSSSSNSGKAELFANFFKSVYVNENDQQSIDDLFDNYGSNMQNLNFTFDEVLEALLQIDTKKGTGPDKVHPLILKNCAHSLALPLQLIFNKSLSESVFPNKWKISHIMPIFKSGSKSLVTNYRAIVKMPTIGKLFESMINKRIKEIIAQKITPRQHGFVNNRSTSTNVVEFVDFSLNNIESGNQIDVLYTDFLKAFDRVDHRILIEKLKQFDLNEKVIKWIWSYLRNRSLNVKIGSCVSSSFETFSGVPQGSHLGPTLFTMFINDLAGRVNAENVHILLFADDTKSYAIVNNENDAARFQSSIDQLNNWCIENKLPLNVSKCKIMSFHRKENPHINNYVIGNENIERVDEIRDLGIILDPILSFNTHIDTVIAKSFASLGFLKRMCSNMQDPYTLKSLYCAHVRSILEYASVVWHPQYQSQIDRIESIQHKFTSFALRYLNWNFENNPRPNYETRCAMIAIETLERRRINANLYFIYDLLNGFIDAPHLCNQVVMNEPVRVLRNNGSERIRITTHRTNYGQNAPLNRMSRLYNAIDDHIRLSNNRNNFRSQVKLLQVTPNLNFLID